MKLREKEGGKKLGERMSEKNWEKKEASKKEKLREKEWGREEEIKGESDAPFPASSCGSPPCGLSDSLTAIKAQAAAFSFFLCMFDSSCSEGLRSSLQRSTSNPL